MAFSAFLYNPAISQRRIQSSEFFSNPFSILICHLCGTLEVATQKKKKIFIRFAKYPLPSETSVSLINEGQLSKMLVVLYVYYNLYT